MNSQFVDPGQLKQLPIEARHTICLEMAKKKRQSVSSSIFIPDGFARKNSVHVPSNKVERKQMLLLKKYGKLKKLKIQKPGQKKYSHPESFAIMKDSITKEQIMSVVKSLKRTTNDETLLLNSNAQTNYKISTDMPSLEDITTVPENVNIDECKPPVPHINLEENTTQKTANLISKEHLHSDISVDSNVEYKRRYSKGAFTGDQTNHEILIEPRYRDSYGLEAANKSLTAEAYPPQLLSNTVFEQINWQNPNQAQSPNTIHANTLQKHFNYVQDIPIHTSNNLQQFGSNTNVGIHNNTAHSQYPTYERHACNYWKDFHSSSLAAMKQLQHFRSYHHWLPDSSCYVNSYNETIPSTHYILNYTNGYNFQQGAENHNLYNRCYHQSLALPIQMPMPMPMHMYANYPYEELNYPPYPQANQHFPHVGQTIAYAENLQTYTPTISVPSYPSQLAP